MTVALTGILLLTLGLMAYIRFAPSDPAVWNIPIAALAQDPAPGTVTPLTGAASAKLPTDTPIDHLARLDAIAMATPRTTRLAGTAQQGRITWITRSAVWGFPDYTTAETTADGIVLYARLRFGREDMGVNAKRLTDWLARL